MVSNVQVIIGQISGPETKASPWNEEFCESWDTMDVPNVSPLLYHYFLPCDLGV